MTHRLIASIVLALWGYVACVLAAFSQNTVTLSERAQITLLRGSSTVAQHPSWEACLEDARARARAETQTTGSRTFTCQTERRQVIAAYSAALPPPPPPPDPVPTPVTGGVYTDLASAPVGAWVTAYCANGSKLVTQYAGTPFPACGQTLSIATHQGRVLEVTPATIRAAVASWQAGDVLYLRAGTYSGVVCSDGWNGDSNFDVCPSAATAEQPIAIVGYPGEVATLTGAGSRPNFVLGKGGPDKREHLVIANLNLIGNSDCIDSGANTGTVATETGAAHVRVVGNTCTITNATGNTMTGLIAIGGDDWKVLGNTWKDPANRTVINNNHVIYVQNGADDVEIAYNTLVGLHVGHVIQVHQDGGGSLLYERIHIHDNLLRANSPADMRGITTSLVADASTILIENNRIENVGQGDWGWLNVYRGQVTAQGNVALRTQGGVNVNGAYGGSRRVILDDNQICLASGSRLNAENGASLSQITETNPRACP